MEWKSTSRDEGSEKKKKPEIPGLPLEFKTVDGAELRKGAGLHKDELIIEAEKYKGRTGDLSTPRLESAARRELTRRFMEKHREEISRSVRAAEQGRVPDDWRQADDLFEGLR
ncbi:hypothetical protein QLQ12_45690 [Actinoplanes sp. NEAU-A12]|uniref:Uncharacterized protein n=1 Tax=Actinoplanes sandaracinus TaxID=3045177 RepID=A0ABT6X1V1_9ACTN|nr:hypothetical protein [Actinoplanes sandaracinus]